jgi:hypothetical protein
LPVVLSRDEVVLTRRDQLPEAQGCTVGCVWRWLARRRSDDAEGPRCRQQAHAPARGAR